jgi:hypothetical protein
MQYYNSSFNEKSVFVNSKKQDTFVYSQYQLISL